MLQKSGDDGKMMMRKMISFLLRLYQCSFPLIREVFFLNTGCLFVPSCSDYARESVERFGVLRGALLGFRRILRCHPFCRGGVDLVPEK